MCIIAMIIFGSIQLIMMLLSLEYFESVFFVLLISNVQLCIIFGIAYIIAHSIQSNETGIKRIVPPFIGNGVVIGLSGVFYTLMCVLKMYSSHPERTPPVFQCVIAGLALFPNILFTRIILQKNVTYKLPFALSSTVLLLCSIGVSVIPLVEDSVSSSIVLWIFMYFFGVIARSMYCIMQEKFFMLQADGATITQKLGIMFYTNFVATILSLPFYGLEYIIGYGEQTPHIEFVKSGQLLFTSKMGLFLEFFILAYVVFYGLSAYLNSFSSNYNMVSTIAISPIVAIFFTIFTNLNPGIAYPWYIVIPTLVCSVGAIVLWIFAEQRTTTGTLIRNSLNRDLTMADGFSDSTECEETLLINH